MEFQIYDTALVPLIIAVVEVIKKTGVSARWIPVITLVLSAISSWVYVAPDDPAKAVIFGLVMGFSAMGVWSGAKNTISPDRSNQVGKKA